MATEPRGPAASRFSTLSALSHRDYRLVWIGFAISNVGVQMQTFGLGWYLVQLAIRDGKPDQAPLYLGLVAATRFVPGIGVGLLAGSISDRVDRRTLLTVMNTISGVIAAMFAVLVITDSANLPLILVLSTLAASAQVFSPVTTMAMVPRLVPRPAIASGVGLFLTTQSLAALFGPLIGGVLIGPVGVGGLMVCNAAGYLAVVAASFAIRPMPVQGAAPRGNLFLAIGEGIVYVWRDPVLRPLFALTGMLALSARPLQQLLPAFAIDAMHVGATELSWMYATAGAGAFAASLTTATFGGSKRRGMILAVCALVVGIFLGLFAMQRELVPALVLLGITNYALQVQIGLHVVTYQSTAPDDVRGRVTALSSNLVGTGMSLGALLLGIVGSVVGIDVGFLAAGVIAALTGVIVLTSVAPLRDSGGEHAAKATSPSH